ncbi:putative disease resistance protein RGA3 [Macadamia integrifolia]|uniref:putative disease resistance protein RGA3 n=1 Tax=Macadamia integrifolia TaxID=60698 RepID=UPI001C4F8B95|nr:putative disease resistance protein RGA3 [Macadamia integrifolia]XP_042513741.1 putative disease resistance protein RGA3 [Macadamia integrifolia]XP_042513742.1 putative disease resistance protein RGA3 [Macadamia integrifolia]
MAEGILSSLAAKILQDLGSLLVSEIELASRVKKELRKLEGSLSAINAILLDAETKGAMNHAVKDWLRKLKDVAYDAEDVFDEFATELLRQKVELPKSMVVKQVRRWFSSSNPLFLRATMAHKIKDIIDMLDHIQKDGVVAQSQFANHREDTNIGDDYRGHTDPFVIKSEVLGREKDKEDLVQLLTSDSGGINNVMVISIIGIGGLGKTTLAQYVYNDERVESHFELRMWVCVSFDFNVVHLAKKILESLTNKKCDDLGENQVKSKLLEKLSGKRYLVVLDDVWNEHSGKWENLRKLLTCEASGSMILVTTRSEKVASIMHPIKSVYPLKGLNENDCESLFIERAFGKGKEEEENDRELVEIGQVIVKKCRGVPLAAKALGSLLCFNRNKKDWLDVLNTEIWTLGEQEQEILPALRISYNQLPSHLKQCFAYCSMFPQDHEIDVDDLIHQWMAHGLIKPPPPPIGGSHRRSLEDIGYGYFRELLLRSFFQEVREDDKLGNIVSCKMHDLMHSLARWVAGREWSEVYVEESRGNSSIGGSSTILISIPEGVRHMVFHGNAHDVISIDNNAQKLRTLCLQRDSYGLGFSNIGFISSFRCLRLLKLRGLGIRDVPSSIGDLKQLRYLDLSRNDFEALPNSICRLYNLQTLRLEDCKEFKEWPRDMKKMVSLRHLEFDANGSMFYMPHGLGQLASLQTLGFFIVGENPDNRSKKMGGGLEELHGLKQLGGKLVIYRLGNVRDSRDAEEANLKEKSELQYLNLNWRNDVGSIGCSNRVLLQEEEEQVLGNLQPHPNLKALIIEYYGGFKMPRWMIHSSSLLPNLVELTIYRCSNLKCLPLIGECPCLKHLTLYLLHALESICNKVVVTVRGNNNNKGVLFPMLEKLVLRSMSNLERWTISVVIEEEEEEEGEEAQNNNHLHLLPSMFPCLTELDLSWCHKLTTIPMLAVGGIQHLTSLRKLKIERLERLVSLPDCPAPATLDELHIEDCPSLVTLPDYFFENLKSLSKFEILACGELTSLPEGIQHLISLKWLYIDKCPGLTTLPHGMGNLALLQVLEIRNCSNLSSLPEGIQQLTALEMLRIDNCLGLKTLPQGLGSLSSLEKLEIWDCSNLSLLPEGIQCLTALKVLSIRGCNDLHTLPEGLGSLTLLKELHIGDFPNLSSLPKGIQHLTALRTLGILNCPCLKTLPDGLGSLSSLQKLEIQDCSTLSSMPEGIQHLTSLKMLGISKCGGLKTLPDGLGSLSSLEEIEIQDCYNLLSLPKGIRHLTALKWLSIYNCRSLRALPDGLGNLALRGGLKISGCPYLSLPMELMSCDRFGILLDRFY